MLQLPFTFNWWLVFNQEKHLQQAIAVDALQKDKPIIPTPDSQADIPYYDSIYPSTVKLPRNLIKLSG